MKTRLFPLVGKLALPVLLALPLCAAENWVRYDALPSGSKAKVDGTSTIHDWTVESRLIAGHVEFESGFNLEQPAPGKVNARCVVTIPVRQLKSDSDKMNTVMYEHIKQKDHPRIEYRLTEMTLKEAPKSADAPVVFDSKGELSVAGVTNLVQMPVSMIRVDKDKLKFTGSTSVKMTSFGIQPPTLIGILSTGDDVKISFEWLAAKKEETK
jgi:polyisoprenoid-binding protein YceI